MAAKLARYSWLPGGLAAALVIAMGRFFAQDSAAALENGLYDRVMRVADHAPSSDVVIVAIDSASVAKLGPWPWPRDLHANLVDRLRRDGARVVAFTAPFDNSSSTSDSDRVRAALELLESSNLDSSSQAQQLRALLAASAPVQDPYAYLARAMKAHGNVVLPVEIQSTRPMTTAQTVPQLSGHWASAGVSVALRGVDAFRVTQAPSSVLAEAASAIGHTSFVEASDGVIRSDLSFARIGSSALPSLATAIAARSRHLATNTLTLDQDRVLAIGDRRIPLDSQLRSRPHYFRLAGEPTFKRFEYWQVLAGEIDSNLLRDKIVLIGITDPGLLDSPPLATPVSTASLPVAITASTVSSLVQGPTYSTPLFATAIEWSAALLVIAFAAFLLPASGVLMGALATVLLIAALVVAEIGLLSSTHAWARLMLPALAAVAGFGLYVVGELIRSANVKGDGGRDAAANLRTLGQTFQKQGQLDLAFETYRRCPLDAATMELLYYLGMDFENGTSRQKPPPFTPISPVATRTIETCAGVARD